MKKYLSSCPELVKEWHPTKNGNLTPKNVTYGSKKKIWWLCSKGHEFESMPNSRTSKNSGCGYCSGRKLSEKNNLLNTFPELSKEWHPTKNLNLTPKQVTSKTNKKVWWLCPNGHTYDSKINSRTASHTNCPYCSGRRVGEDNNLLFVFPEIAKEWHPTKNGNLTPKDITSKSDKKVWWLCSKGHSFQSIIKNRTSNKSLCPQCSNQSSEPEIRILSEMKWFFDKVLSRYKFDGVEIDIYIPEFNLGIEYDGKYWHRENEKLDLEKNEFLLSHNINLIRVREYPLKSLSSKDIILKFKRSLEKKHLDEIVKKIYPFVNNNIKEKINSYFKKTSFVNDELFKTYRSYFPSPFPEKSLLSTHPSIATQWDYDKNYPLRPENFSFGSGKKMWWICPNGHSYEATLNHRTSGNGCPFCSGRKTLNYDLFK